MSKDNEQDAVKMSADGKHADLYLLGDIGDWWDGNTAHEILYKIQNKDLDTITVYLSTLGGTFEDGLPIYNLLQQHKATVTFKVIGYAMSMGSSIMLSGDRIEAAQNSVIMIHEAQGFVWGNKREMRDGANMLETHEKAIMPRYMERMKMTADEVRALLEATTYYTADEALEVGLIDAITDPVDLDEADKKIPENSWKKAIENYGHAPAYFTARAENALKSKPSLLKQILNKVVGSTATDSQTTEETDDDTMTPEQLQELKDSMAASNKALATDIVNGLKEALAPPAPAEPSEPTNKGTEPPTVEELTEQLRVANEGKAAADAKATMLEAEVVELKKPADDHTPTPENMGEADVEEYDY